jgi:hypothetical protein
MSARQRLRRLEDGPFGQSDRPTPRVFRIVIDNDEDEASERARLRREGMKDDDLLIVRKIVRP